MPLIDITEWTNFAKKFNQPIFFKLINFLVFSRCSFSRSGIHFCNLQTFSFFRFFLLILDYFIVSFLSIFTETGSFSQSGIHFCNLQTFSFSQVFPPDLGLFLSLVSFNFYRNRQNCYR